MKSLKLISFDLDNTLWPEYDVLMNAVGAMNDWLRQQVPAYFDLTEEDHIAIRNEVIENNPRCKVDVSKFRVETLQRAFVRLNTSSAKARSLALEAFAVFYKWRQKVEPYPGAEALLQDLANQYTLVSITNGNADVRRTTLGKYFDLILSAADVGIKKPDAAIFQMAMVFAGAEASQSVHVGDHALDDIQGARDLGMDAVLIKSFRPADPSKASAYIEDIRDLPAALASLR